jgi:molybdenum cofactor guanylyltransferase
LGSPKGLALVGGDPIIERVLRAQREVLPAVAVVANEPRLYGGFGAEVIPDLRPGLGPLAGIHAGLLWAAERGANGAFCAPCDAPFLRPELVRRILARCGGWSAVVPRSNGRLGYEPLFGWYSVGLAPLLAEALEGGRLSAQAFISSLDEAGEIAYVPLYEVAAVADPELLFFNVNTPDDLQTAERREAENRRSKS